MSKASINCHVARAETLSDDIDRVVGTSLDKGTELDTLAAMPAPERTARVDRAATNNSENASSECFLQGYRHSCSQPTLQDFIVFNLPAPKAKQLSDFNRDRQSVIAAMDIAETLRKFANALRPATLGFIAQSLSPGLPIANALVELQVKLDEALSETIAFNAAVKDTEAAENARIKPVYDRAVIRFFELSNALPGMIKHAAGARKAHEAKVEKLIEAGLSKAEAKIFAGESREVGAASELASARADHAALDAFIKTKDESLLPVVFLPVEA